MFRLRLDLRVIRLVAVAAIAFASGLFPAHAETPLERGTYLMKSIVACGNCHTPKGPKGEIPGMELAGFPKLEVTPAFTANAPNITQDIESGIGGWTDAQIVTSIREGRRPDGSIIGPPMPISLYRGMSDTDVNAIVAYLRTVRPVKTISPSRFIKCPCRHPTARRWPMFPIRQKATKSPMALISLVRRAIASNATRRWATRARTSPTDGAPEASNFTGPGASACHRILRRRACKTARTPRLAK